MYIIKEGTGKNEENLVCIKQDYLLRDGKVNKNRGEEKAREMG
jgi:hypothetical protein